LLGTLGDYGGPTQTIPLLPGSPAIGKGTTADYPGTSTPITTDQRGLPLDSPTPDIGAFQTNPLVVNTTLDGTGSPSGDLSLRQAVDLANALGAAGTGGTEAITFDPTVFASAQTITLDGTQLELTSGTETITGPGANLLSVSGNNASRVFQIDSGVTASISGLTITKGNSGGLFNLGAATLTNCTVSRNYNSARYGGGLVNYYGATAMLTNCTVSGNSTGFGGGGLVNQGTATLTSCTVSGNSAVRGGGLDNYGRATLTNCTVSRNYATRGGGLDNDGRATLTNCTVSGNSARFGAGLDNYGTATLTNTIVAGNTSRLGGFASDIKGATSVSGSYNLIGTGGSGGLTDGVNHNQVGVASPLLGTLGDYGGPTQTIPLLPGSPAIGKGSPALAVDPSTGQALTAAQRGYTPSSMADIGAFQDQGFVLTPVAGSTPQAAVVGTAFATPLAVTVTANNTS
jgi:hypothetical protein